LLTFFDNKIGDRYYTRVGDRSFNYPFLTQKERDNETGLDYFGARYYGSTSGRFTSADPLYLEMHRLTDPQQLNLYSYVRNDPTKFNDPTGLDIHVVGDATDEYLKGLQQDIKGFKVAYDGRKIVIVDEKGKKLDKKALDGLHNKLGDRDNQLFSAITDGDHHVTIAAVLKEGEEARSVTTFGGFAGNQKPGLQVIDFSDIRLLDTPENRTFYSPEQAVGHETLEAYYGSFSEKYADAHDQANQWFPGLEEVKNSGQLGAADAQGRVSKFTSEFSRADNPNLKIKVTGQFLSPVPASSMPQPSHIIKVEKVP
jgi:RHS repeat-associated protein